MTVMTHMSHQATAFDQDIGRWDASAVEDMSYLFHHATAFNRDIGRWGITAVARMHGFESGPPCTHTSHAIHKASHVFHINPLASTCTRAPSSLFHI